MACKPGWIVQLVIVLALPLCGLSCRSTDAGLRRSATTESTPSSSDRAATEIPCVGLSEIRFAYVLNGRVACELSDTYAPVFSEIERWPEYDVLAHDPWRADLTPREEHYALAHIAEKVGDPYTLFLPESYTFVTARLSTVTLLFTGLGTFGGIMGILDVAPGTPLPGDGGRALAFRFDFADRMVAMRPPAVDMASEPVRDAVNSLKDKVREKEFVVMEVERLSTEGYPDTLAMVVQYTDEDKDLYFLTSADGAWKIVPPDSSLTGGSAHFTVMNVAGTGVIFDQPHAETHAAMFGSRLIVLPDLNGDGFREIFVNASYDILYAIQSGFIPGGPHSSGRGDMTFVEIRGIGFV